MLNNVCEAEAIHSSLWSCSVHFFLKGEIIRRPITYTGPGFVVACDSKYNKYKIRYETLKGRCVS